MTHALDLASCTADVADMVGGKAVGLGALIRQAREVPPGFVVTTNAYREWVEAHSLDRDLERICDAATTAASQEAASREIHELFHDAVLPDSVADEVRAAYARLGDGASVAVRSSATAEDQADASFAGQQETYLGISGDAAVLHNVVRCWASLFTPQAISYRRRLGIHPGQVAMAVLVQRMVEAEAAGVMLTIDPVTGDRSQITIEAAFGLGAPIVGGELTPDRYTVDKVTMEIRSRSIAQKPFAERIDAAAGGVRRVDLGEAEGAAPSLQDPEIFQLAELGKETERTLGTAADMEWAIGPGPTGPRHLYLLQSRPETVWSRHHSAPVAQARTTPMDRIVSMMLGSSRRYQR